MPMFPMFVDLTDRPLLMVGAGVVAQRKLQRLAQFGPRVTVVSPEVRDEIAALAEEHGWTVHERPYEARDLDGAEMVFVAVPDDELQEEIAEDCAERRVPCNCVDVPERCSFVFPALVLRGDAVIGISSSGKAPGVSSGVRKRLDAVVPAHLADVIADVELARKALPPGDAGRRAILDLCKRRLDEAWPETAAADDGSGEGEPAPTAPGAKGRT